jgi:hypothetical protein
MTPFGAQLFEQGTRLLRRQGRRSRHMREVEFVATNAAGREVRVQATVYRDETGAGCDDVHVSDADTYEELPDSALEGVDVTSLAAEAASDDEGD